MADLNRIPGVKSLITRTERRLRDIALWKAFWPFIALTSVYLIAALLGVFEGAPKRLAAFAALLFFAGTIIAVLRGVSRFRSPPRERAIEELDRQSDMRPLASLADRPAIPNKQGVELWTAHEERLTDALRRLVVPRFKSDWQRIDPYYLRAALPAALLAAVALNLVLGNSIYSRLSSALSPDYGSLFGAENVRIEAWVTPPPHTGRAPIFLTEDQQNLRVPKGSVMTLRAQAPSTPKLRTETRSGKDTIDFTATPDGAFEGEATIEADTVVSVRWWGERQAWTVLASPDDVPTATFVEVPKLGKTDQTEFEWSVTDDYGVETLHFAIRPAGTTREPDLVEIDLGAVFPREASDASRLDMTRNRWAGARVDVWLQATDGAGQIGKSAPHEMILPEKLLLQPLAKAIQDVRVTVLRDDTPYAETLNPDALVSDGLYASATQRLAQQAPAGVQRAAIMLEAVTYGAPRYYEDILIYTGLRSAQRTLEASSSLEEAKATEPLLWGLALRAEYGTAADALAALLAARAALEEALRDGASEEEIARRMEAFKDAAQRYVAARMAEAMANGLEAPPSNTDSAQGPGGSSLGGQDFSDMLDALQDLTETGATDQARQLLADITNMLENLEFQQGSGSGEGFPGMPGEPGESEDDVPQEERELTETMRELSELLRQQRELNDETLAQQRGEGSEQGQTGGQPGGETEGETSEPGGEQGQADVPDWMEGETGQSLADRQNELGDLVEELARRNGGLGSDAEGQDGSGGLLDEDQLEAIERAQRRAGRALEDGNELRALRNQEQATRQLRDLAEGLAEQLDIARQERLGEGAPQPGEAAADPFGRSSTGGIDDSDSVDVPDEAERQRAKDILDELRRRYGDTPDEEERDYLERLLDRF
ncbi:MAG: DUF4175 family protein [Henriciella sp.]|nr:DUF4175 family protein [Henriciella sp.]